MIEALLFSFFTYVLYVFCFGAALPVEWRATSDATGTHATVIPHRWRVLVISLFAVILGFVWGYVKSDDLLLKQLRKWRITERTTRESVWNDVFLTFDGFIQVGLADGRMAMGCLDRYSDTGDEGALFLRDASWIDKGETEDKLIAIPGAGLLLAQRAEIQFVMF